VVDNEDSDKINEDAVEFVTEGPAVFAEDTGDPEFVPPRTEPVEEKEAVYAPLSVVPVAPVKVTPDILIDDDIEPEFAPEGLLVPPDIVIAGPVEETPETTDDCTEPTLMPPVLVTEGTNELIEYTAEPEFVPFKVVPEAIYAPLEVDPMVPLMVPPDMPVFADNDDAKGLVVGTIDIIDDCEEPILVPPLIVAEDPSEIIVDAKEPDPLKVVPEETEDKERVYAPDPDELTEDPAEPESVLPKVVPEDPEASDNDNEAVDAPLLVVPVAPLLVVPVAPLIVLPDILSDDNDDPVFIPEELTDDNVEPYIVTPEYETEDPDELKEDTVEPEFVGPEVVPEEPAEGKEAV
jgi:hypothetical protein